MVVVMGGGGYGNSTEWRTVWSVIIQEINRQLQSSKVKCKAILIMLEKRFLLDCVRKFQGRYKCMRTVITPSHWVFFKITVVYHGQFFMWEAEWRSGSVLGP